MSNDIFADIGTLNISDSRKSLVEVKPPELPDTQLPATRSNPRAAFKPARKMHTEKQLKTALATKRRTMAPFAKDLAPALRGKRKSQSLTKFQWRMETDADRTNFLHPIRGKGKWENITVPHFGGPIGRAVAYYRTTFTVTREMIAKGALFTHFDAVDYKAHVFVNGHFLGSHEGFFAPFEFECLSSVKEGENTLLVKVENDAVFLGNNMWQQDEEGDKLYAATNLGWDDAELGWHHCPPGFGIYQGVTIEARAPMHISDLFVRPLPDDQRAEAWVEIWSKDRISQAVSLEISVYGQNFKKTVIKDLAHTPNTRIIPGVGDLEKPTDNQEVNLKMGPGNNVVKLALPIDDPRIWDLETPWLYQLQVKLLDPKGNVLDTAKRQFGMRTFTQDNTNVPKGRLYLNGREIKLRGANTMGFEQQDVYKGDLDQLTDDLLLAKLCNMNFLRLTQRPVQREIYEYADRLGLMTQTDLPLFGCLRYNKFSEAVRQAEEMERLIRSHACNVMISYINEPFPNASGKPHRHLVRKDQEAFFAAADLAVRVLNPDRVIKHVDGDYDPPSTTLPDNHCYCGWYNGHGLELGKLHRGHWMPTNKDWSYACGEFGSEGLEASELMHLHYPKHWLPEPGADEASWNPSYIKYAQTYNFHFMWFDAQHSVDDWVRVSQQHQTWATRLFTERFRRDNRMVSFAIHLFIDAFPAGWMKTIMDCERRPKPAYFAYRDALEPLTVSIRTDRWKYTSGETMPFELWVSNDTQLKSRKLTLRWQIEQKGKVVFAGKSRATVDAVQSTFQGYFSPKAPEVSKRTDYTVRMALCDGSKVLVDNSVDYTVFPTLPDTPIQGVKALGKGVAAQLLKEMGVKNSAKKNQVVVVDDFSAYEKDRKALDLAVADGTRLIFLELPVGEYLIGGDTVKVEPCVMCPREFVSRDTGHPMVKGFQSEDFKCWYEPEADCFLPLLHSMFDAPGWDPVLTNGNGVWMGKVWQRKLAAAEKPVGKGAYHVCQVKLATRTRYNPTADRFARRLLGQDCTE